MFFFEDTIISLVKKQPSIVLNLPKHNLRAFGQSSAYLAVNKMNTFLETKCWKKLTFAVVPGIDFDLRFTCFFY